MLSVLHHILLTLSVGALGASAVRASGRLGARGLDQAVAAAPLAVGIAVVHALVLGIIGLGSSPVALPCAAVATWLATHRWLPPTHPGLGRQLLAWWGAQPLITRVLVAAGIGITLAWSAWLVKHPAIGRDGLIYHLPKLAAWVEGGQPGSLEVLHSENPFQAYPGTNEVALAWAAGISQSLVSLTLWTMPLLYLLLAASSWSATGSLGALPVWRGIATAALCTSPMLVVQPTGPNTDLASLAWLVCAGALCLRSVHLPALLGPALVAAGLAVGTKTSTLAPLVPIIASALWVCRDRIRAHRGVLAFGIAGGLAVSGLWYLRNFVEHGSPLWPFVPLGGDPTPPLLRAFDGRVLADPVTAVGSRVDVYLDALAGGSLVLVAAFVLPFIVRRRALMLVAALAAFALVAWAAAPTTGFPADPVWDLLAHSQTRFLLPTLAIATLAVAVAAGRSEGAGTLAARAALCTALVWNLVESSRYGYPVVPGPVVMAIGAIAGVVTILAVVRLPPAIPFRLPAAVAGPALLAFLGLVLVPGASGYVDRYVSVGIEVSPVVRFATQRQDFEGGEFPVAMAPYLDGALVGDTLSHRVRLIPPGEPCGRSRARADEGWVVVDRARFHSPIPELRNVQTPATHQPRKLLNCLRDRPRLYRDSRWSVFGPLD